jgi:hypothetical protein
VDGFSCVPSELTSAAKAVGELGEQLAASPATGYGIDRRAIGHQALADAVAEAQVASRHAVGVVCDTARATAQELTRTARGYLAFDQGTAGALRLDSGTDG